MILTQLKGRGGTDHHIEKKTISDSLQRYGNTPNPAFSKTLLAEGTSPILQARVFLKRNLVLKSLDVLRSLVDYGYFRATRSGVKFKPIPSDYLTHPLIG